MKVSVTLTRQKCYTEDGTIIVEAVTQAEAVERAVALAKQEAVEFLADAGGTTVAPGSLRVLRVA